MITRLSVHIVLQNVCSLFCVGLHLTGNLTGNSSVNDRLQELSFLSRVSFFSVKPNDLAQSFATMLKRFNIFGHLLEYLRA